MWWLGWASQEMRSESHWPTKSTMKSLLHTCCWGARMRWVYQLSIFIYFVCLFLSQNEKILHYIHIQDGAVYVIILILFTAVLCRSFSCNHSQNTIELHVLLNIPAWILRLRHEINDLFLELHWTNLILVLALRQTVKNLIGACFTVTLLSVNLLAFCVCSSVSQTESSVSRSGSSLSLARVRPGAITNGTSKHTTSSSSSGAASSSSGHKAQRSASTYHRQRRHSDFCKAKYWDQWHILVKFVFSIFWFWSCFD